MKCFVNAFLESNEMSTTNLEDRVAALESGYANLLRIVQDRPPKDAWRKVVGMFADDPQIDKLHRETSRIREEDRTAARCQQWADELNDPRQDIYTLADGEAVDPS